MFAVAVYFTYSVQFFVPVQIIWPILKKRVPKESLHVHAERLFRCILVLFTYALAVAIPHLGNKVYFDLNSNTNNDFWPCPGTAIQTDFARAHPLVWPIRQ